MKNILKDIICIFLVISAFPARVFAQKEGDWQLMRDEDNIRVYTRNREGSTLEEFKAICVFKATPAEKVYNALIDFDHFSTTDENIKVSKTLKADSTAQEYTVYYQFKTPLFIKDRDVIYCHHRRETSKGYFIESVVLPTYLREDPNHVRMREGRLLDVIRQLENGDTEYIFSGQIAPGGSVPIRVVNRAMISSGYERMVFLRKVLAQNTPSSKH